MKYFLHDSNARNDEKITLLFIKYGYEGVGLFFTILEILSQQEKPINKIVLEAQLKIRKRHQNFISYMIEIGLISLQNDEVFNENLLKYSENYQIRKEKNSEKIKKWRENQQDKKNVTSYEPECNRTKVKESKVNNKDIKNIPLSIDNFREDIINEFTKTTKLAGTLKTSVDTINKLKLSFLDMQECKTKLYADYNDAWDHFVNWVTKQEIKQPVSGTGFNPEYDYIPEMALKDMPPKESCKWLMAESVNGKRYYKRKKQVV